MKAAKPTIVVADNNRDFLKVLGAFLRKEGYLVILAASVDEAKRVLRRRKYDIVILDVRLSRDDDENDNSGLMLATTVAAEFPKIILTRRPNSSMVREALGPKIKGLPAADFVTKDEVGERLLPALEEAIFARALQAGKNDAWGRLWKEEASGIIALCRRHGIKTDDAINISMEIFGEVARLIKRYLKRSTLRTQLVSGALRRIKAQPYRQNSKKAAASSDPGVTGDLLANEELLMQIASASIAGGLPRVEFIKQLTMIIEKLPTRQREVITLRLFRLMSTPGIAEKMGITEKTVVKYTNEAFSRLRSKVIELGG